MGCCNSRMILGSQKSGKKKQCKKSWVKPFTIADLRGTKHKGLYTVNEVGASQEFSLAASRELNFYREHNITAFQSELQVGELSTSTNT